MDLSFLFSLTSEEEIKKLLTEEVYETLTAGDPAIVKNALTRAAVQVWTFLGKCPASLEEHKEAIKLALEKLTLYEIAMHADVELSYEGEKKQAYEILRAICGEAQVAVKKDPRLKRWQG